MHQIVQVPLILSRVWHLKILRISASRANQCSSWRLVCSVLFESPYIFQVNFLIYCNIAELLNLPRSITNRGIYFCVSSVLDVETQEKTFGCFGKMT